MIQLLFLLLVHYLVPDFILPNQRISYRIYSLQHAVLATHFEHHFSSVDAKEQVKRGSEQQISSEIFFYQHLQNYCMKCCLKVRYVLYLYTFTNEFNLRKMFRTYTLTLRVRSFLTEMRYFIIILYLFIFWLEIGASTHFHNALWDILVHSTN